jgi:glutathione-regulated potassium-efflux system ancillary protein KefG
MADAPRTLLVFTHPALERTRLNWAMAEAARGVDNVTFRDLYELYPDFAVDVGDEQSELAQHDLIVLQFPLYWYTGPALLKEWLDLVWIEGFAYGEGGNRLAGKTLACAVSTGARSQVFRCSGDQQLNLRDFLRPFEQVAEVCGMRWAPPFAIHASTVKTERDLRTHTDRYRKRLETWIDKCPVPGPGSKLAKPTSAGAGEAPQRSHAKADA